MVNLGKIRISRLLVVLAGLLCGPGCDGKPPSPADKKAAAQDGKVENKGAGNPSANITRAKLHQVKGGMSEQEIKAILGAPSSAGDLAGGRILIWEEGERKVQVTLQNGKAQALIAIHLDQEVAKLTRENVDRLQPGMSEVQVVQLLGPGKSETWSGPSRTLVWEHEKKQVEAAFVDGKLILTEVKGFK
jgi:outer membrane protein assembly factor BamE (lipoprotein component of BamABCDE complex)